MTVISIYSPTLTSSEKSIMSFYQNLRTIITKVLKADKILLFGDFNARVTKDYGAGKTLEKHGPGKMNN